MGEFIGFAGTWRANALPSLILSALLLPGCANQFRIAPSTPAASQGHAGTILVAPTMVAPWDDVSASLKPNFALTGDQAAAQVLPTTEGISEQVLSAFGASLSAGLPTKTVSSKSIVGGTSPGTVTTTDKESGVAPAMTSTLPTGADLPGATGGVAQLGLDPVLKYKAANYLLQEVQLLNQEIDNAASRSCFVPYVVKLKIAVINFRPRLPYSVHTHIAFSFNGRLASQLAAASGGSRTPSFSGELNRECQFDGVNPTVIPFLVADDVQVALKSRAAEAASQIGLGLSALVGGVGISGNANALQESLTAISNHDLTSTLTVGRESDSALYAMIAPNNQASDQASLTSQTYDVAVLLLVPRSFFGGVSDPQSPTISVSSFSEYRDARSGEVLKDFSDSGLAGQADDIIRPYLSSDGIKFWAGLSATRKAAYARDWAQYIKMATPDIFFDDLACTAEMANQDKGDKAESANKSGSWSLCVQKDKPLFATRFPQLLYARLGSLLDYDRDKLSSFQAQLPSPISLPSQQVVLNDDGSHPVQTVLGGVRARSVTRLAATLSVTPFDTKTWTAGAPVSIPAQAMALDTTAHTLTVTFPSLKKFNIGCLAPAVNPDKPVTPTSPSRVSKTKKASNPGTKKEEAAPGCPNRFSDPGTQARPNNLSLRVIGCDPGSQLCPAVTDTVLSDREALDVKLTRLIFFKGLADVNVASTTDALARLDPTAVDKARAAQADITAAKDQQARMATLVTDLQAVQAASITADNAALALKSGAAKDKGRLQRTLDVAQADLRTKQQTSLASASAAHVEAYLRDYAIIGVVLASAPTSTDPSKVAISNVGPGLKIDPETGEGQLVLTVVPIPATDTVALSISGGGLKSIADGAGMSVAFTAKHGFVLPQAGVYVLNLSGLRSGVPIVVTTQALKGDATDGDPDTHTFKPDTSSGFVPQKPRPKDSKK